MDDSQPIPEAVSEATPTESLPLGISAASVAKRVRLTFALATGFYIYALLISAVFVASGVLFFVVMSAVKGLNMGVCIIAPASLFCFATALFILWNLVPRPRRFIAPGPRFDLKSQPKLLEVVSDVAQRASQKMPSEFYMLLEANAGVTERGGIFGARKRRVMMIGLPLLPILSVSQFRSVLAHEFGHYYWGDTRLGPWINRTYQAIDHTLEGLVQAQYTAWINLFFFWYSDLFHEIAQDLMKKQEYLADRLAAQIAGPKAFIEGMQLSHTADDLFQAYWDGTIQPLVAFGIRVPILEGFSRYIAAPEITKSIKSKLATLIQDDRVWNYDYHPMFSERVAAVGHMPVEEQSEEDPLAITLLSNPDELDIALLTKIMGKERVKKLKFVSWEEALEKAYLPMWENTVRTYARGLAGVTPDAMPDIVKNLGLFGTEMLSKSKKTEQFDSSSKHTSAALGAALALALRKADWQLHISPGEAVRAQRGNETIEPFRILGRLIARQLSTEEWREQCTKAGITGVDYSKLAVTEH